MLKPSSQAEHRLLIEKDVQNSYNNGKGKEDNPFNPDSPSRLIWDECYDKLPKLPSRSLTSIERDALSCRIKERAKELAETKRKAGVPFIKDYDVGRKHYCYLNEYEKAAILESVLIEGMVEGCSLLQAFKAELKQNRMADVNEVRSV